MRCDLYCNRNMHSHHSREREYHASGRLSAHAAGWQSALAGAVDQYYLGERYGLHQTPFFQSFSWLAEIPIALAMYTPWLIIKMAVLTPHALWPIEELHCYLLLLVMYYTMYYT